MDPPSPAIVIPLHLSKHMMNPREGRANANSRPERQGTRRPAPRFPRVWCPGPVSAVRLVASDGSLDAVGRVPANESIQ